MAWEEISIIRFILDSGYKLAFVNIYFLYKDRSDGEFELTYEELNHIIFIDYNYCCGGISIMRGKMIVMIFASLDIYYK